MSDTLNKKQPIERKVSGYKGITEKLIWIEKHNEYRSAVTIKVSNILPYRAMKRVKILGKWTKNQKMFATLKEAVTWRMTEQSSSIIAKVSTYTIKNLIDEWLPYVKMQLTRGTAELYERDVYHLTALHNIAVEDLRSEDIDHWIKKLIDPSYRKSKNRTSFEREIELLKTILNWYREMKNSQYRHLVLKRHTKGSFFSKKPKQKKLPLTEEQLESVLECMKNKPKKIYYYLASLQALSGLRIGEACALKWNDIDLDNARMTIQRIVCWEVRTKNPYIREGTKTNEGRIIKLCDRLIELFREMKNEFPESEYLFQSNGQFFRYNAIQNANNRTFVSLKLPHRSTHVFRHTFATLHADQTKNIRATQGAMGHSDYRTTQIYANVSELTQEYALSEFRTGKAKKKLDLSPNVPLEGMVG